MSYLRKHSFLVAYKGHAIDHGHRLPQVSGPDKPICLPTERREFAIILPMDIGHRIKQARQAAGLSQRELADAIGVTHGLVGQWESHKKAPGRENLRLIAGATGVTSDQLLGQPGPTIEAQTSDEAKLLRKFRQMSGRQRKNLLELVDMSADLNRQVQHQRHPIEAE